MIAARTIDRRAAARHRADRARGADPGAARDPGPAGHRACARAPCRRPRASAACATIAAIVLTAAGLGADGARPLRRPRPGRGLGRRRRRGDRSLGVALLSPRLVTPLASLVGAPLERLRGVPGRLARENAVRNPARTASTAAALMIGLALVSFVAVFAAGLQGSIDDAIDKTIAGDLIVSNDDGFSDIPVGDRRRGRAASTGSRSPRRCATRRTRSRAARASGFLTLVDPRTAAEVLTLDWDEGSQELLTGLGPNDAVIDEKWGEDNGLGVGDTFEAKTASGETLDLHGHRARSRTTPTSSATTPPPTPTPRPTARRATPPTSSSSSTPGADAATVQAAIDDALDADFPTVKAEDQRGAQGLDRRAAQHAARGRLRAAAALGDRLAVRDRQHARALDPRAHPRARPAARASAPRAARCAGSSATRR